MLRSCKQPFVGGESAATSPRTAAWETSTGREKTLFEGGELKENHAEIQNTFMEEKDNIFRSLGGGHTALLSYHSHRGYFKAPNCKNYAVF